MDIGYECMLPQDPVLITEFIAYLRANHTILHQHIDRLPNDSFQRQISNHSIEEFIEVLQTAQLILAGVKHRTLNQAVLECMVTGVTLDNEMHFLWIYISDTTDNRKAIDCWLAENAKEHLI